MSPLTAAQIYAEELIECGHGVPMWGPEPPDGGEVRLADVGIFQHGFFCRLFNAMASDTGDSNNHLGLPANFEPIELPRHLILNVPNFLPQCPISSQTTRRVDVEGGLSTGSSQIYSASASYAFNSDTSRGAIAIPGSTADMVRLWETVSVPPYIAKNYKSWHSFALENGYNVQESDIIFVHGFTKVSEWAIAAFSTKGNSHEISFSGSIGAFASNAHFAISVQDAASSTIHQRCGPVRSASEPVADIAKNQCLFLRFFKMKPRRILSPEKCIEVTSQDDIKDVYGGSRTYPVQPQSSTSPVSGRIAQFFRYGYPAKESTSEEVDILEPDGGLEEVPGPTLVSDDLDCLLDYILENSRANMAVASHDNLYNIFDLVGGYRHRGSDLEDLPSKLRRIAPVICVDNDGVGTLAEVPPELPNAHQPYHSSRTSMEEPVVGIVGSVGESSNSAKLRDIPRFYYPNLTAQTPWLKDSVGPIEADKLRFTIGNRTQTPQGTHPKSHSDIEMYAPESSQRFLQSPPSDAINQPVASGNSLRGPSTFVTFEFPRRVDHAVKQLEYTGEGQAAHEVDPIIQEEPEAKPGIPSYEGLENYKLLEQIGHGTYSEVYKAIDLRTKKTVAIKAVCKDKQSTSQHGKFLRGAQIMRSVNHPSVVELLSFIDSVKYHFLVLEFMEGGNIFEKVVKFTHFSEDLARHIILQVALGIRHLHEERGVVHRNIKPESILFEPIPMVLPRRRSNRFGVDKEGEFMAGVGGGGIGRVKIANFELSKVVRDEPTGTPRGSDSCTAPEILKKQRYSKAVDMWGLGCVLSTMLCGSPPSHDSNANTKVPVPVWYNFASPYWRRTSKSAQNLIMHLLCDDPLKRYTIDEFLLHPWCTGSPDSPSQNKPTPFSSGDFYPFFSHADSAKVHSYRRTPLPYSSPTLQDPKRLLDDDILPISQVDFEVAEVNQEVFPYDVSFGSSTRDEHDWGFFEAAQSGGKGSMM